MRAGGSHRSTSRRIRLPGDVPCMTAPRQCAVPEPADLEPEHGDRRAVHGHSVVASVPTHNLTQPCAHHWDRIVQPPPQLGLTSLSFACPLFRIVCLTTVNRPLLFFPQMCVKP